MNFAYIAFYKGNRVEIKGEELSRLGAKQQAFKLLNVPANREHMVYVELAEKDGKPVVHCPSF